MAAGWFAMTYHLGQTRMAMTAIAAVLASTSTPLLAQDTGPADSAVETPPVASDPLAPATEPAPTATETALETAAEPEPAAAPPASRPKVETARAPTPRQSVTPRPSASRAASTARTAAPAPPALPSAEFPAATVLPPVVDTQAVAEPVTPVPAEAAPAVEEFIPEDMLPVAGGAALGLLGLGGVAMAMRRRKRRREEEELEAAKWAVIEASAARQAQAVPEPAFARRPAPAHDPVPARAAAAASAEGPAKFGWTQPNKGEFMLRRANAKPATQH